jgi:hypothetical protein
MPFAFVLYPTPLDAHVTLKPDSGGAVAGIPYSDASGRPGQLCTITDGVPTGQGAELNLEAPGYLPLRLRGFLQLKDAVARLQVDDYTLNPVPVAPEPPPPTTGGDPASIINAVYATGEFDLSTHSGCGQFVEQCLADLMAQASPMWGHILKTPGQNQYNGHAVDALMLLAGPGNGIFDIIQSSVSPDAKPQYIRQGDPDPDLWYQPTDVKGVSLVARPTKYVALSGLPHPTA